MSRAPLFNPTEVRRVIERLDLQSIDAVSITDALKAWAAMVQRTELTESQLEQAFNQTFFCQILGYSQPPGVGGHFTMLPKAATSEGSGFPDFLLGKFKVSGSAVADSVRLAVGELKGPGQDLDWIDPARGESAVEQAFDYARKNGIAVRWVIVSNLSEIRLYHHTSIERYEGWRIGDFVADGGLTDSFWSFYALLRRDHLLGWPEPSQLENLLQESIVRRARLTDDFYDLYRRLVADAFAALSAARPHLLTSEEGRLELLHASQLLIHRGLVICFFSDHPAELLPRKLLQNVIDRALESLEPSTTKIYRQIKFLFNAIENGSPPGSRLRIFGYDGGLFKPHHILDDVDLPDELFTRVYVFQELEIHGIYGFRIFDFATEFNEHLLGRIFEESVGDLELLRQSLQVQIPSDLAKLSRHEHGLYYTRESLADFVARSVIQDVLREKYARLVRESKLDPGNMTPAQEQRLLQAYLQEILRLRILDPACGSGAFLVSCYRQLVSEARRIHARLRVLRIPGQALLSAFSEFESSLLRSTLMGNDIVPEAVEIAKLSLWLTSARKDTMLGGLDHNFAVQDALESLIEWPQLEGRPDEPRFDIVVGNPPWGANVSTAARRAMAAAYPSLDLASADSFELFILQALRYLKPGGRLAYVLPHTLLLPEKKGTRQYLLEHVVVERYHNLGADWFGSNVRMNTNVLQVRKEVSSDNSFSSMTLVEDDRRAAILGIATLEQFEESYAYRIPQQRCKASGEIELFRYAEDDDVMGVMESNSLPLGSVTFSERGVELNRDGEVIQCPSCGRWVPPSRWRKDGGHGPKKCELCKHTFAMSDAIATARLVVDTASGNAVPYVETFSGRYRRPLYKGLRIDLEGVNYKDPELYKGKKLLIRQAGVGMSVTLDEEGAYCPQSMYIYKVRRDVTHAEAFASKTPGGWMNKGSVSDEHLAGLTPELLLGVLSSRTFAYYTFKRFGEIDAAQAFAKMTHERLRSLAVPIKHLASAKGKRAAEIIERGVKALLSANSTDLRTDWGIERAVQDLYGLGPAQRAHVTAQLGLVGYHKAMQELFPIERPPKPQRTRAILLKPERLAQR